MALARSEKTVQALRDVGLALGSTLDLDQLLELILNKITELLEADRATLYLLDEQRGRLLSRIMVGEEAHSIELPLGEGIAGYVAKIGPRGARQGRLPRQALPPRVGRPHRLPDALDPRRADEEPRRAHHRRHPGAQQEPRRGRVLPARRGAAHRLATQAAVSIDNSRLFLSVIQKNMQLVETKEQLEHRVADLKLLFELETRDERRRHDGGARPRGRRRGRARLRRARGRAPRRRAGGRRLALLRRSLAPNGARARGEARRGQAQRGRHRLGDGPQRGHQPAAGRGAPRRRRRRPGLGARSGRCSSLDVQLGDRRPARGRGRRGRSARSRSTTRSKPARLLAGRSRAPPPRLGERVHRGAPLPLAPRARAQRAAHDDRAAALRRDARHAHAAHRDQRLRAAHDRRRPTRRSAPSTRGSS